jgi:hypothetical protein
MVDCPSDPKGQVSRLDANIKSPSSGCLCYPDHIWNFSRAPICVYSGKLVAILG